jgi:hypothetical protein
MHADTGCWTFGDELLENFKHEKINNSITRGPILVFPLPGYLVCVGLSALYGVLWLIVVVWGLALLRAGPCKNTLQHAVVLLFQQNVGSSSTQMALLALFGLSCRVLALVGLYWLVTCSVSTFCFEFELSNSLVTRQWDTRTVVSQQRLVRFPSNLEVSWVLMPFIDDCERSLLIPWDRIDILVAVVGKVQS